MGTGIIRGTCRLVGLYDIADKIDDFWLGNKRTSRNISKTNSYDEQTVTVDELEKLKKEIDSWKKEINLKSKEIELKIYKDCSNVLNEFKNKINELNSVKFGDKTLNINIDRIERKIHNLDKEISDTMKIYLLDKFSIDNDRCKEILKMEKGEEKQSAMDRFLDENLKNAFSKLNIKVKNILNDELQILKEDMRFKLNTIKQSNDEKIKFFNSIITKSDLKIKEKELLESQVDFKLKLNQIISSII